MAAAMALGFAFITGFISWFVFPFFARNLITKSYLQRGWQPVKPTAPSFAT